MHLIRLSLVLLASLAAASFATAAVAWRRIDSSSQGILPAPARDVEPTATLALDVDGDRDADLLVAGRNAGPAITLYRYDRAQARWTPEIIEPDDVRIEAGGAAHDIDGDGDLDVVFGGDFRSGEIWWWENPHPAQGQRWTRRALKRDANMQHHDQIFGDFDGDKQPELVSWNQRAFSLLRFAIPANPKTEALWPADAIFKAPANLRQEGLARADVDGDGVEDIIGGGYWFRHTGGGKFAAEVVDAKMNYTRSGAGQLVKGGRAELVFAPGDLDGPLNWYSWENGQWVAHTLVEHIVHGHNLQLGDIDGDGHLDVFIGEMGNWTQRVNHPTARVLVFFGDGRGNFQKQIVNLGQGVHECRIADLDGDGDLDIFAKPFRHHAPRLVVWMNEGNFKAPLALNKWQRHLIDDAPPAPAKRLFIEAIDLDGDGRTDLVSGDAWFRNPGRIDSKWEKHVIGAGFGNVATSYDVDRDGDIDLIGTTAAFQGNQFVLAVNDGRGGFKLRTDLPAGSGDFLQGVLAAKLQTNTNMVVLSWHKNTSGIEALVFPDDGAAGKWELKVLSPFSRNEQVSIGDIDRDANADLLLGDHWLRNTDKEWTKHEMGSVAELSRQSRTPIWRATDKAIGPEVNAEPDRNRLVDVNGDGWLDAVVSLEFGTHIVWFEHPGSATAATGAWKRHVIGQVAGQGFSMDAGDFDADGDVDVIVGEHRNPEKINRAIVLENADGRGGQWRQHVIDQGPSTVIDHHDGTLPVDLDGDGDLDVATIGFYNSKVWVIENQALNRKR